MGFGAFHPRQTQLWQIETDAVGSSLVLSIRQGNPEGERSDWT